MALLLTNNRLGPDPGTDTLDSNDSSKMLFSQLSIADDGTGFINTPVVYIQFAALANGSLSYTGGLTGGDYGYLSNTGSWSTVFEEANDFFGLYYNGSAKEYALVGSDRNLTNLITVLHQLKLNGTCAT